MVDYDGATVSDSAGEKIGSVERTYVDDNEVIRFVEVKTGALLPKHHLVPADQAQLIDGCLRVPYTKDMIEESPSLDLGDSLEANTLDQVRQYYATADRDVVGETASEEEDADTYESLSKIRDLGDVIEIPIVEEIL